MRPEFLNILFFQQKSLLIYPNMDLRQLHIFEIFIAGYIKKKEIIIGLKHFSLNLKKFVRDILRKDSFPN